MQFTKIQDKDTNEITRYYINGKRVTAEQYEFKQLLYNATAPRILNSFSTTKTRNGNFKHVCYG